jgi:hypothetical protein
LMDGREISDLNDSVQTIPVGYRFLNGWYDSRWWNSRLVRFRGRG